MGPLALRLFHYCASDALSWQQLGGVCVSFSLPLKIEREFFHKENLNCMLQISDFTFVVLRLVIN